MYVRVNDFKHPTCNFAGEKAMEMSKTKTNFFSFLQFRKYNGKLQQDYEYNV